MNKIVENAMLGIFVVLLFSNTAISTTWIPEASEISYQVNHSDRIVTGTVKELHPAPEYTDVTISVEEWLKNPLSETEITVRTERGTSAITEGAADFSLNEKVLLMLNDDNIKEVRFKMAFMELGKHPVSDKDKVIIEIDKLIYPAPSQTPESLRFEKKTLLVGNSWKKDGWNMTVDAIDNTATPGYVLTTLSYQDRPIGETRIETGKSYTYLGKTPDGSSVPLLEIRNVSIFTGTSINVVALEINWSVPGSNVQILDTPEESDPIITMTPVPTPAVQATPEAPGFSVLISMISFLIILMISKK